MLGGAWELRVGTPSVCVVCVLASVTDPTYHVLLQQADRFVCRRDQFISATVQRLQEDTFLQRLYTALDPNDLDKVWMGGV